MPTQSDGTLQTVTRLHVGWNDSNSMESKQLQQQLQQQPQPVPPPPPTTAINPKQIQQQPQHLIEVQGISEIDSDDLSTQNHLFSASNNNTNNTILNNNNNNNLNNNPINNTNTTTITISNITKNSTSIALASTSSSVDSIAKHSNTKLVEIVSSGGVVSNAMNHANNTNNINNNVNNIANTNVPLPNTIQSQHTVQCSAVVTSTVPSNAVHTTSNPSTYSSCSINNNTNSNVNIELRKIQQSISGMKSSSIGDTSTSTIVLNQSASSSSSSISSSSSASLFQPGGGIRKSSIVATPDSSQFTSKSLSIVGPQRSNIYLSNVIAANASTQQTVQHRFGLQHGSQGPAPNVTVNPNGNFNMNTNAILKPAFAHSLRQFGMGTSSTALNSTNQQTPSTTITSSKLAAQLQTINQIASSQKQASAKVPTNPTHLSSYAHNMQSAHVQKQLQKAQHQQRFSSDAERLARVATMQAKAEPSELLMKSSTSTEDQIDGTSTVAALATNRNSQPQPRSLQIADAQSTSSEHRFYKTGETDFDDDIEDLDTISDQLANTEESTSECVVPDVNLVEKHPGSIDSDHVSDDEPSESANRRIAPRNYFADAAAAASVKATNATIPAAISTGPPSTNHQHHSNHISQNQYHHHIATTNLQCLTPSSLNTSTTNINSSAALKIMVRDVLKFVKTNKNQSAQKIKFQFFFSYFSYKV